MWLAHPPVSASGLIKLTMQADVLLRLSGYWQAHQLSPFRLSLPGQVPLPILVLERITLVSSQEADDFSALIYWAFSKSSQPRPPSLALPLSLLTFCLLPSSLLCLPFCCSSRILVFCPPSFLLASAQTQSKVSCRSPIHFQSPYPSLWQGCSGPSLQEWVGGKDEG